MIEVREYVDANGRSPFGRWFDSLNVQAAKITAVLEKIAAGNLSNVKGVGDGMQEYRLD